MAIGDIELEHSNESLDHNQVQRIARTDVTVMLGGETGSGKGRLARTIHQLSTRRDAPMIAVDCTSIPDTLFESQLFGVMKGAFTGADRDRMGLIRAAHGGTLFLDEIGELTLGQQAKFLTFLQERSVLPVGGTERIAVDVRLIAATHRDLESMVERGEFREDLYFRLSVIEMEVSPLRDRLDELEDIIEELVEQRAAILHVEPKRPSQTYLECLYTHDWPGNIRELGNAIERSLVLSRGSNLDPETLPTRIRVGLHREPRGSRAAHLCAQSVQHAITESGGNKSAAARRLGISRRHLYRLIDAHEPCHSAG